MIFNIYRTVLEVYNYLEKIQYPRARIITYAGASIIAGVILSNSINATDLPILTVVAVLFGFTINAVVMLGNSSEHYLSSGAKHGEELEKYYRKSLYISIHTLGIGLVTIVIAGLFQLFPNFNIVLAQGQILGYMVQIDLIGTMVYSLVVYYLIVFSTVIASTAELVKIRI